MRGGAGGDARSAPPPVVLAAAAAAAWTAIMRERAAAADEAAISALAGAALAHELVELERPPAGEATAVEDMLLEAFEGASEQTKREVLDYARYKLAGERHEGAD